MTRARLFRTLRRALLGYARRVSPGRLLERSKLNALVAARRAAATSSAYSTLLAEHNLSSTALNNVADVADLPVLRKSNTFERFELQLLASHLRVDDLASVLTSSGHGGKSFGFSLTTHRVHENAWFGIDMGLQDAFDVDRLPTLLVNCLPMGVVFSSRAVTVANLSVREDMACAILKSLGPRFAQTIICTDPLFVNRLLDHADEVGIDWRALNTSLILGEEMLVESQRDYIAMRLGIDLESETRRVIASSLGVGELGLNLLFESRETIALRRAMRSNPKLQEHLTGSVGQRDLPLLLCFNPLRSYVEAIDVDENGWGELCITMLDGQAVIPLPRYACGDLVRLISPQEVTRVCEVANIRKPWLPMLALRGRMRDRPPEMPSVEEIKEAIYADAKLASCLTGAFRLEAASSGSFKLNLQVKPDLRAEAVTDPSSLQSRLRDAGYTVRANLISAEAFVPRPFIDYERKFRYIDLNFVKGAS